MASPPRQYHTLDRDPSSDEWDECPICEETLQSKGRDPHVDEYDIYEYFVCDTDECRVREVIGRYREDEPEEPDRESRSRF